MEDMLEEFARLAPTMLPSLARRFPRTDCLERHQ